MTARNLARRAILEKSILDHLNARAAHTKEMLADEMSSGDRLSTDVGIVYVTAPKTRLVVKDRAAFLAWVKKTHPTAVFARTVLEMSAAAEKDVLSRYPDEDGLLPDGVDLTEGRPILTVKPSPEGVELAASILPQLPEVES